MKGTFILERSHLYIFIETLLTSSKYSVLAIYVEQFETTEGKLDMLIGNK